MSARAGTDVVIAPMRAAHIEALMPFERSMFGSEAWTANGYRSELADTEHRYYVVAEQLGAEGIAAERGSLVGWAGVLILDDTAEILTVGVVPSARRRGIARALVDRLVAEAVASVIGVEYVPKSVVTVPVSTYGLPAGTIAVEPELLTLGTGVGSTMIVKSANGI